MKKELSLDKMSHDRQVEQLRAVLRSGKGTLTGFMALFALRHNAIKKHNPESSLHPSQRWYLGQLAKEYIRRHYAEAKETLESFAAMGLLDTAKGENEQNEFVLKETLFPALREVLEETFGKETVDETIARAKFYKDPASGADIAPEPDLVELKKRRSRE